MMKTPLQAIYDMVDHLLHVREEADRQIENLQALAEHIGPIVSLVEMDDQLKNRAAELDEREDALEDREHSATNKKKK